MARTIKTPGALPAAPETAEPEAQATTATGLPNAIDIDAKKIKGPVLTNQGWVCPDETGQKAPDSLKP